MPRKPRDKQVGVRFTAEDLKAIDRRAKQYNLLISEYIRACVFRELEGPGPFAQPAQPKEGAAA